MPHLPAQRLVALALVAAAAVAAIGVTEPRLRARQAAAETVAPPAPILEYVTFGHRRGVSAALWLQLLTWYGGKTLTQNRASLDERRDIVFLQKQSRLIIRMDPDFSDPYSFAALVLTWYAGEPGAALPFLEAAMTQFPDQWEYPFYYAFIQYRFLHDNNVAAVFLERASRLARAPAYVPLLAARLRRHEEGTADALATLRSMLATHPPESVRRQLEEEVKTLEAIAVLEDAVARFRRDHGRVPSLDDIIDRGYLPAVPVDAWGMRLFIDSAGKVGARGGGLH